MNTPLEKFKKEAQSIRLSQAEKAAMRARIEDAMRISVRPARAVKSTYMAYSWRMVGSFATLVVVVLGSGTTYAAQGALPGSPLYPIKVGVNEPIKEVLAFSNEAKVEFHTEVAETRLEEAEALAAQGRLDSDVSATLAAHITEHVERVQTIAKEIEAEDPSAAFEVTVHLDSSIAAHNEVLAYLGDKSDDEPTRENSMVIAYGASNRNVGGSGDASGASMAMKMAAPAADIQVTTFAVEVATEAPAVAEDATPTARVAVQPPSLNRAATSSTLSSEEKAVNQLERKVDSRLKALRSQYNALKKSLTATTSAAVEARIHSLEDLVESGDEAKNNKDFERARAEYNAALGGIVELSTFLTAGKKFNKGILDSLLKKYNFEVGTVQGMMDEIVEGVVEKNDREKPEIKKEDRGEDEETEVEAKKEIRVDIGL